MKAKIHVTLKNGVLDPQGKAIAQSNDSNLDYEDITHDYEGLWIDDIYEEE